MSYSKYQQNSFQLPLFPEIELTLKEHTVCHETCCESTAQDVDSKIHKTKQDITHTCLSWV
jgi:hypothetical protein